MRLDDGRGDVPLETGEFEDNSSICLSEKFDDVGLRFAADGNIVDLKLRGKVNSVDNLHILT